jgi:hypothetical protein
MSRSAAWPPWHWKAIAFLAGFCLMVNHFHDQGIRYHGSEVWLRSVAIWVTPLLLLLAGVLAIRHARVAVRRLIGSILACCAVAFVPLVLLEISLFPTGHGASQGLWVAMVHLPFVGVFLAGLWSVAKVYRGERRKLLAILAPAPAGWLFGSVLVYGIVFARRVGFHWERCQDAAQFLICFF